MKQNIESFQAILFDFDGVLAECMEVKTEAFAQMFKPYGEEIVKKVVDHHLRYGGISRYKKIEFFYREYLNKEISNDELNELAKIFSDFVVAKVIESNWVKGAKEFLEKYYKNIDMFIISGTPQEELKLIVKKRGMKKYFKGVYGSPDTKPTIVKKIITENEYNFEKLLYIGDSLSDYYDAKEVGIKFIGRIPKGMKSNFPGNIPIFSDFKELLY